jgi:S1-C subfamily serine protease
MKKLLVIFGLLTVFCFGFCCSFNFNTFKQTVQKQDTQQDYELYKTVGQLYVNMSLIPVPAVSATGFAIDEDYIVTATHFCLFVLKNQMSGYLDKNIFMNYLDGQEIKTKTGFRIVKMDVDYDLCLIKGKGHGLKPVEFYSEFDRLRIGDVVQVVGAPLGVFPVLTEGRVVSLNMSSSLSKYATFFFSADVTGGNSGGPIFYKGKLVGVVLGGAQKYTKISVGVSVDNLVDFLEK